MYIYLHISCVCYNNDLVLIIFLYKEYLVFLGCMYADTNPSKCSFFQYLMMLNNTTILYLHFYSFLIPRPPLANNYYEIVYD